MCILPHIRDVFRGLHSFFFTFAVSSCVKPAGIIVQVQEICWTVTKRIDSSCSVRCHALHDCHQTWSFQQAPSSKLINMRCGWALPSQCVGSTQHVMTPHPTHPPQPHVLRSIKHVCNFNDVITPHPTHPPQPHVLRSIKHVCNFNDVITPHPTHPPNPTHVTGVKENASIPPFRVGEARSKTRRYVRLEPKTKARVLYQNKILELFLKMISRTIFLGLVV